MRVSLSLIVLAGLSVAPASATTFCHIKKTKDGFVALRAGPGPATKLLHRMRPGDEVLPSSIEEQGDWVKVTWWRGGRFRLSKGGAGDPPSGTGWMNRKLIEDDSCG